MYRVKDLNGIIFSSIKYQESEENKEVFKPMISNLTFSTQLSLTYNGKIMVTSYI